MSRKQGKRWLPLKYESLRIFYFSCECLGHSYKDLTKEDFLYSLALKVELNLVSKEVVQLNLSDRKTTPQSVYIKENAKANDQDKRATVAVIDFEAKVIKVFSKGIGGSEEVKSNLNSANNDINFRELIILKKFIPNSKKVKQIKYETANRNLG